MILLGGRLLLFTLVIALVLGTAFLLAREPIEQKKLEAAQTAQRAALPQAQAFEEMPVPEGYPLVTGLYAGKADGDVLGYVLTASPYGYSGPIPITMSVGVDGSILGIEVGDLMETPGFGTKLAEPLFLSQYDALAADPAVIDSQVDIISGSTVSSEPFKAATMQMAALTMEVLGVEPNPGTPAGGPVEEEVNPYGLVGDFETIRHIRRAGMGKEILGYSFELAPMGFQAPVVVLASIDIENDTIASVTLISQNDTAGYGTRLEAAEGDDFFAQFAGKSVESPLDGVDVIGGVTVTCDAVKKGVAQASAFYTQYLNLVPDANAGVAFEDIDLPTPEEYRNVQSAQRGMKHGAVAMYRFVVRAAGYAADYENGPPILMQVDVDAEGNYLALEAIENPETPGFGNKAFEQPFTGQFIGKPATVETAEAIDTVSGATVSSDAVMRGLRQAARAYQSIVAAVDTVSSASPIHFEDIDLPAPDEYRNVQSAQRGMKGGAVAVYRFVVRAPGYAADYENGPPILMQVDVDADGNYLALEAIENPETPGFGNKAFEQPFTGQFIGKAATVETAEAIDTVSGATVSSDAVMRGLRQAARAYQSIVANQQ